LNEDKGDELLTKAGFKVARFWHLVRWMAYYIAPIGISIWYGGKFH